MSSFRQNLILKIAPHCCFFCGKLVKNLWVHQRRLHVQESRVKAILESVENQVLIDKLQLFEHKIRYDYENNIKVLKEKSGILLVCKKSSDNYQVYVMKFFFTTLILYTFCGYENSINLNFRIIRAVRNVRNLFPVKTISRISKKITGRIPQCVSIIHLI